jgi:PleD family two-component response regulator
MPVMDGFEATQRVRQLPALAEVPIIATSASATSDVEARCRAAGANGFVRKPIDHIALLEMMARLMSLVWSHDEPGTRSAPLEEFVGGNHHFEYPPVEELHALRRLAGIGNVRSIRQYAQHLRSLDTRYASFASRLEDLAKTYQFGAITALVDGNTQKG